MNYIRLTKNLNVDEIKNGSISKKEAYKIFINDTIFEPHGRFLGQINGSKSKFKLGCTSFFKFLSIENNEKISDLFYKNLRCGMFHSMNMEGILIDSINFNKSLLSTYGDKYVINVNIFYNELKKYIDNYIDNCDDNDFNSVFDELILSKLI